MHDETLKHFESKGLINYEIHCMNENKETEMLLIVHFNFRFSNLEEKLVLHAKISLNIS